MTKKITRCKCIALDDFGRGITRINNETIFVDNFLIDEEADIKTIFKYGKIASAKILKLYNENKNRVKPKCPYYYKCGGCNLMHLNYLSQLEYKKNKVQNLIKKITKEDIIVNKTIPSNQVSGFRTKIQKKIGFVNKEIQLGFYKENTHDLIPIKKCLSETDLSNNISQTILKLIKKYHFSIYNEDTNSGDLKHILIKVSGFYNEVLVTLVSKSENLKGRKEFAKELISCHPEIKGVNLNINSRNTNVILGEKEINIYGLSYIKDKIFDYVFTISPTSFYQTNSKLTQTLYDIALKYANITNNDVVLDAYCGTGTISICASKFAKKVIGVEINKAAVSDAIYNLKRNKINNCQFICDDTTNFINKNKTYFDIIILDPPRKGCSKEFIEACINNNPKKIVYISCDPSTLARDLFIFKKAYDIKEIQPVDMFPNTSHIETVCLLINKDFK